ncbi:U2 snRNP complex subunit HSH49 [Ascoidea rubescens DSM 1968]|uniref:RNA-binding domain-containing protein n=1 Tax=Ascoidea rubescens DSM 1968 TaxID=1344418 RepID=A0A1D2VJX6_9ASCO|nr:RNA-binding domain-containing protein [Ascoidea rubescens DSM 1968]ODV61916.1 RNA-binding domain-containing protein [Ascoidea rubescens DSM 1968]
MILKKPFESEKNQDATVYIGNLDEKVDEVLLYELVLQVAPIKSLNMPKDRILQVHQGYAFVELKSVKDSEYVEKILNGILLYSKPIKVKKTTNQTSRKNQIDVGAKLFISNLDELIDENYLNQVFSKFGNFSSDPIIIRDSKTGKSKGFGFLNFDSFESSDLALKELNNKYLMNKIVFITYAFKKDGKGEKHGDEAERLLAAQAKKNHYQLTKNSNGNNLIINNFSNVNISNKNIYNINHNQNNIDSN